MRRIVFGLHFFSKLRSEGSFRSRELASNKPEVIFFDFPFDSSNDHKGTGFEGDRGIVKHSLGGGKLGGVALLDVVVCAGMKVGQLGVSRGFLHAGANTRRLQLQGLALNNN